MDQNGWGPDFLLGFRSMLRDFAAAFRLRLALRPRIVVATMVTLIAIASGGCGIKGPLKPAPGTTPPPTSTPGTSPPTPTGTSDPGEPESKP
jgi:predicted small lipoprotein YifL